MITQFEMIEKLINAQKILEERADDVKKHIEWLEDRQVSEVDEKEKKRRQKEIENFKTGLDNINNLINKNDLILKVLWTKRQAFSVIDKKTQDNLQDKMQKLMQDIEERVRHLENKKQQEIDKLQQDNAGINRQLSIAINKIKLYKQKDKQKDKYKNLPDRETLLELANKHRFKNGKINFSKLGRELGVTHHTAKSWCKLHKIS